MKNENISNDSMLNFKDHNAEGYQFHVLQKRQVISSKFQNGTHSQLVKPIHHDQAVAEPIDGHVFAINYKSTSDNQLSCPEYITHKQDFQRCSQKTFPTQSVPMKANRNGENYLLIF